MLEETFCTFHASNIVLQQQFREHNFAVNLLTRYSSTPTQRHWNGVKHILCYLYGITKIGLFYSVSNSQLIGYTDASYLSNPHKRRSQICYLFIYGGIANSWRFVKQTLVVILSNHLKIIAIHEASQECIWLRSIIQHIKEKYGLLTIEDSPTTLFEDNVACITQLRGGYIKGHKIKHISLKFFYTHELQQKERLISSKSGQVII